MNTIDPVQSVREPVPSPGCQPKCAVKVIGVGGAGASVVEALIRGGVPGESCAVLHADAEVLARSEALEKIQAAPGGSPVGTAKGGATLGEEPSARVREFCAGAETVCLAAGLGGRTGTELAPLVAQEARSTGAVVLAFVTLPFDCEGSLRQARAQAALPQLAAVSDGLLHLPNQKAFPLIGEQTRLADTFAVPTQLLAEGVRGVWRLLARPAQFRAHLTDLCALLGAQPEANVFATGDATGANRFTEAVERLLAHPWLAGGEVLRQSEAVLVSVAGGPDLTMAEVHRVMEQVNRQCEQARVLLATAIDATLADRLVVTLLASAAPGLPRPAGGRARLAGALPGGAPESADADWVSHLLPAVTPPRAAARLVPPAPELTGEEMRQLLARQEAGGRRRKNFPHPRQTQLHLEIVSKGRFDKSEPTIHKGEDLDLPTYVRRGVVLN